MIKVIDVYPYKKVNGGYRFLILKRSGDRPYAGQWRMVGGKVRRDEKAWQAALRELREETGATPRMFWTIPSLNHFYEHSTDQILLIPAFAAELQPRCEIRLDGEHTEFQWIEYPEVQHYIYWPEQQRLITLIHSILTKQEPLDDWKIAL